MRFIRRISSRAFVLKELFSYLWQQRLWWMIPLVIFFMFLGILVFFAQSPALSPFIYTLF